MASFVRQLARTLLLALKRLAFEAIGRERWQKPDLVLSTLSLTRGMRVADLGSGLGYFTFRFAGAVGESGVVYAVDTDADLREAIRKRARARGLGNVRTIEAPKDDPGLPEPVDLIFLSGVYHHLPEPGKYFARAIRHLRPGGRVAILEAKPRGLTRVFGHATQPERIRREMEAAGYRPVSDNDVVARQSLLIFTPGRPRPEAKPSSR